MTWLPPRGRHRSHRGPPRCVRDDLVHPEQAVCGSTSEARIDETTTRYFDQHVDADAAHAAIAAKDLAGSFLDDEPALVDDVVLGANVLLGLEGRCAQQVPSCWEPGVSSLTGIDESNVAERT